MPSRQSVFLLVLLAGCSASRDPGEPARAHPFIAHALPSAQHAWREGVVVERLTAGPYVYLRLREDGGATSWLVSLRATTPPHDHVRALVVGRAAHFRSQRLERDFSPLDFAAVRSAVR